VSRPAWAAVGLAAAVWTAVPTRAEDPAPVAVLDAANYAAALDPSGPPTLLYFYNKRCTSCASSEPLFAKMAPAYSGRVQFCETEIFNKPGHWSENWDGLKQSITTVPTFVFVVGGKEIHRVAAGLDGDDSDAKQRQLRCLIDLALLKISKGDSQNCSP
jgi:hypothetical protein